MDNKKRIYSFGNGAAEGSSAMKELLGGKGADLAEMAGIGLPVPAGFTLTTDVCMDYNAAGKRFPLGLEDDLRAAMAVLEGQQNAKFGDAENPLLVSVRSGARASMPGMMDTVLNLGLNDETVKGLSKAGEWFAYDSYRRFIQMYGDVVLGVPHYEFEDALEDMKRGLGVRLDTDLSVDDLKELVKNFGEIVIEETGDIFPQDVWEQLHRAIEAVFGSWMNKRAVTYRILHDIPEEWGTAVSVQAMVFGNMGEDCATGVAFTRDPSTGENALFGEFLVNAQGEDVVAGIRTPQNLTLAAKEAQFSDMPSMEEVMPSVFKQLKEVCQRLEAHYKDMQDIEFTVQKGRLYMLQTRMGKRTTAAALRIAVEMAEEGLIEKSEAIDRIDANSLEQLLHPRLDPYATRNVVANGLPASPGAASGAIVFTANEAEEQAKAGKKVILVRRETSPEDIHGMHAAEGILTARGGMTSHAAVVARGMGRACIAGAAMLQIDYISESLIIGPNHFNKGDIITIDGSTGEVMQGEMPTIMPKLGGDFGKLMEWANEKRSLKVYANAENGEDAQIARDFGAEGIGLCRTEHMFFEPTRILAVREMILAEDKKGRCKALHKIESMQVDDFIDIFRVMEDLPVTIRLLDPPLHEFLPHGEADISQLAEAVGKDVEHVKARLTSLREQNPMLGHRGCRLAITYPEIYEMQARAIFDAVIEVKKKTGKAPFVEVMIPLIMAKEEFDLLYGLIDDIGKEIKEKSGVDFDYIIGTMIELPRAALLAGEIAEKAEFLSFGTNDLTQTTYGLSRDDAHHFISTYMEKGILACDPFMSLDIDAVGELIRIAVERARATKPDLKIGICGEHGGDPKSIEFVRGLGLDYVSCSPHRVPIALLAAVQKSEV